MQLKYVNDNIILRSCFIVEKIFYKTDSQLPLITITSTPEMSVGNLSLQCLCVTPVSLCPSCVFVSILCLCAPPVSLCPSCIFVSLCLFVPLSLYLCVCLFASSFLGHLISSASNDCIWCRIWLMAGNGMLATWRCQSFAFLCQSFCDTSNQLRPLSHLLSQPLTINIMSVSFRCETITGTNFKQFDFSARCQTISTQMPTFEIGVFS